MAFALIIPTLQRSEFLEPLLTTAAQIPGIAEIVVINNHIQPLPFTVAGVRVISPGHNLFVNPAWNLGVQQTSAPRLILCNDDVVFAPGLLDLVTPALDAGAGIVGLDLQCLRVTEEDVRPRLRPARVRDYGFGSLMFMDRSNYVPVPDELRIWCGDDWLFRRQHGRNLRFRGVPIRTRMGTTSTSPEFADIKAEDLRCFTEHHADNSYARRYPVAHAMGRAGQKWMGLLSRVRRR